MSGPSAGHDLLLARDFPPMDGGIARWMAALAHGYPAGTLLVSTGSPNVAFKPDKDFAQTVNRLPVSPSWLGTVGGVRMWSRRAIELARDPVIQFVWCDTIRPAGYVAQRVFRRTGLPYGIMVVGNDVLTLRAKLRRWSLIRGIKRRIIRRVLGDAAVFVAISEWTAARLRELLSELGLEAALARVRVVPLGTDPARWNADPDAAARFRQRRSLPDGRWLVTVARLVEYKGIDTVIRLLATIRDECADLHYAVIGRGPDRERLLALATELGVADRVHILVDVSDDELPAAYSIGNVYVGLTRETELDVEGFGICFAEAAACGLPVIATRSGGIPDSVIDGETGMLLDQDDIAGIGAALRDLLSNPTASRRMGAAGRERVERYLNWERVVAEMREIAEGERRETREERPA